MRPEEIEWKKKFAREKNIQNVKQINKFPQARSERKTWCLEGNRDMNVGKNIGGKKCHEQKI